MRKETINANKLYEILNLVQTKDIKDCTECAK